MKPQSLLALLIAALPLWSCTTPTEVSVVERADDLSTRPDWATLEHSVVEEPQAVFFLGYVEVGGDASKAAALNMADEKAMSEPLKALTEQFLDQNQVGEELRKDASVGQRVISATRGYRPPMAGMQIVHRYWETVRVPNQDDSSATRVEVRAYAQARLSKSDYEQAKRDYFAHLRGDPEVKKILEQVGAAQRQAVVDSN